MWSTIVTGAALIWVWLPPITIVLKFCTVLIGFVAAVSVLVRRIRRWLRRRR
jgi:hypothetical protein